MVHFYGPSTKPTLRRFLIQRKKEGNETLDDSRSKARDKGYIKHSRFLYRHVWDN